MDCLIRRDDNTIAYINKMHKYNPKKVDTPRPKKNKNININENMNKNIINLDFVKILQLLDNI